MFRSAILLALCVTGAENASQPALTVDDAQVTLIADVRAPAREAGVLASLNVREGDLVTTGMLLGILESDLAALNHKLAGFEYQIAVVQGSNDVDRRFAVKSLEVAESELQRSLASVAAYSKSVSKTELDRLRLVAEKSRLAIEQAERDLTVAGMTRNMKEQSVGIAEKRLDHHRIVSALEGMVVEVLHRPGEWLNPGDPVVRIIKLDRLRVEAFVDASLYDGSLLACPARLVTKLPKAQDAEFLGRVVFVSPEVQPVTGQIRVWAEVDNPDLRLRPGMRGTMTIELSKPADAALSRR
jgi:macrolide-specific efflux system membrane fusion protein